MVVSSLGGGQTNPSQQLQQEAGGSKARCFSSQVENLAQSPRLPEQLRVVPADVVNMDFRWFKIGYLDFEKNEVSKSYYQLSESGEIDRWKWLIWLK